LLVVLLELVAWLLLVFGNSKKFLVQVRDCYLGVRSSRDGELLVELLQLILLLWLLILLESL